MGYPPPPPQGPYGPGYGPPAAGYGAPGRAGVPHAPPQSGYPPTAHPPPHQGGHPQHHPPAPPQQNVDLYGMPILVYDQPPQFFSTEANYTIWSPQGHPVAHVREEGVSGARKVLRIMNQKSQSNAERRLSILRPDGMPYFHFYKPYGLLGTPTMQVLTPQGGLIGYLRKKAFRGWEVLDPHERQIAYYELMGGRIVDWRQQEIASVQRAVNGNSEYLSQMFTGADRYVLRMHHRQQEPMRTLLLACPLAFDTAVSQGRSLGGWLT